MTLKLVPFVASDIDILLSWIASADQLRQWAGPTIFNWPLNKQQLILYLNQVKKESSEKYIYKAINADNINIGHIEFDKIDWINKTTVLSRVIISPEFRGKGLGHQLIEAALNLAFNHLKFKEVKLSVYGFNAPAIACYKKMGFKTVDYVKDTNNNSKNWDAQSMNISSSEFLKIQDKITLGLA